MNFKSPLAFYRISRLLYLRGVPVLPRLIDYFIRLVFSCWCPSRAQIGEGCKFGYGGLGVVISESAVIGRNVEIGSGVVIGGNATECGAPKIEDDVYLGAGVKLLGPIRVGSGSVVAANAVVTKDVPRHVLVGGVPARILKEAINADTLLFHRSDKINEE